MFQILGSESQEFNQWEQGKKVINPCMKAGDEVVFRNASGATAVMIAREESGQVVCDVPNKLLQMCCNILVDLEQGKEQHSDCQTVFGVNPADKPDDYVYVDNTIRKEAQPSGSGGGAGKMVVNITSNEDYTEYYSDKTFAEIKSAIESGMNVEAVMDDGGYIDYLRLTSLYPGNVSFSATHHGTVDQIGVSTVLIHEHGAVVAFYNNIELAELSGGNAPK